jgi:hypothetical protein
MEFTLFDPMAFRVPSRKIARVFLHNTGWDNMSFRGPDLAEEINRWHVAEGWEGIGYHFIIDKTGNIATGRPVEEEPNVIPGKRTRKTIDIAVQGLWHFTEPELRSVQVLCTAIHDAFALDNKEITFHGLCEVLHVPNPMFDYGKLLCLDGDGYMGKLDPKVADDVANRASFFVPVAGNA